MCLLYWWFLNMNDFKESSSFWAFTSISISVICFKVIFGCTMRVFRYTGVDFTFRRLDFVLCIGDFITLWYFILGSVPCIYGNWIWAGWRILSVLIGSFLHPLCLEAPLPAIKKTYSVRCWASSICSISHVGLLVKICCQVIFHHFCW